MDITVEERQLRAWVRQVLRHAAIQWLKAQSSSNVTMASFGDEEEFTWLADTTTLDMHVWLVDCLDHLAPRDQEILRAIVRGEKSPEIAKRLHCDVSTVRRRIYRIQRQCPLSVN